MNTRTVALAALASLAASLPSPSEPYVVTPERVGLPHFSRPFVPTVPLGGGRPTTPSKARQVKLKRRAKGRHA